MNIIFFNNFTSGYSNTYIKLNSKSKIKILNFNFIFVPIHSITPPLKIMCTSYGFISFFYSILFLFIYLKSQLNPVFFFLCTDDNFSIVETYSYVYI